MSLDSCGWTSDPPAVGLSVSAGFVGVVDGVAVGVAVAASVVGGVTVPLPVGVTAGALVGAVGVTAGALVGAVVGVTAGTLVGAAVAVAALSRWLWQSGSDSVLPWQVLWSQMPVLYWSLALRSFHPP